MLSYGVFIFISIDESLCKCSVTVSIGVGHESITHYSAVNVEHCFEKFICTFFSSKLFGHSCGNTRNC